MLEADTLERWSNALGANDASGVDQFVQQGQALRSSARSRWIGAADMMRPPEPPVAAESSTPPVSDPVATGSGPGTDELADDQMAVRDLARGRRLIAHTRFTTR
jgi:hypothetical protein